MSNSMIPKSSILYYEVDLRLFVLCLGLDLVV